MLKEFPVTFRTPLCDLFDIEYPILLGTKDVLRAYGVDKFPTNYYVNADGSVSSSSVGLSTLAGMKLRLFAARAD